MIDNIGIIDDSNKVWFYHIREVFIDMIICCYLYRRAQVISVHNIDNEIKRIKEILYGKLHHSFVKKIIPTPIIDEDKLAIIYFLCHDQPLSENTKEQYMIAVMLIQMALDTHECIPNELSNTTNKVEKQMTVLAGDYYSSLYYYVLAELEEVNLIRQLAKATKLINEFKVYLFDGEIPTLQHLFSSYETIESDLFVKAADHFGKTPLIPLIQNLLLYNRLLREKYNIVNDQFAYVNIYFQKNNSLENKTSILKLIDEEIDHCIHEIETTLHYLSYDFNQVKQFVCKRIGLFDKSIIAEEG